MTPVGPRRTPSARTRRALERGAGRLAATALRRMEERHPWYAALPPDERSWVGLVAQAGIAAFVAWLADPAIGAPVTADVFATAPRELASAITLSQTLELVRQCHRDERLLAAICHAPWILISAGIMAGRRATAFAALRDDLINAGAQFVDEPVVRDGHVITSRTPNDLPEFCREIIGALS